jgi:hypothetical protein
VANRQVRPCRWCPGLQTAATGPLGRRLDDPRVTVWGPTPIGRQDPTRRSRRHPRWRLTGAGDGGSEWWLSPSPRFSLVGRLLAMSSGPLPRRPSHPPAAPAPQARAQAAVPRTRLRADRAVRPSQPSNTRGHPAAQAAGPVSLPAGRAARLTPAANTPTGPAADFRELPS